MADFGLAFEMEGADSLTLTGDVLGTPPYMAPEILAGGAGHATAEADVYSLGAMLFQSLTGRTPFVGDSPSEILHLVLHEQPPSVRLLNPAVPRDLETICLKCLEKTPSGRYRDAGALGDDLQRFLDGEPILARPISTPMRVLRWSRRRPALATFIAALALGTVGMTWAVFAINAGRQRAMRAEGDTREELWRANLAHAQAARRTTQAGARREALAAIADAARFRPSLALRNEAIAALCLDDAEIIRSWLPGLKKEVGAIAFAPTLDTYVAEIAPGRLVRRACADDRVLGQMEIPGTKVAGVPVFSPEGRWLAARYADDAVRIWEVEPARVAFVLPGRPSPMMPGAENYGFDLAFRPDGTQLAVGVKEGGFTLHALPGGGEVGRWASGLPPTIIRFSPDGTQLAVVGRELAQVTFVDARTLAAQRTAGLPSVPICAAWNPAGDRLAVGTRGARIHFVDPRSADVADAITVYESGGVGQIVYHPQRAFLVGNGSDEAIHFWDAATGRMFLRMDGANDAPVLAFDPAGRRLCSYNYYTGRAALLEVRHPTLNESIAPEQPTRAAISTGALDVSADGRWLVSCASGEVQLRDASTGGIVQTLPGKGDSDMMTAQFAPGGHALLVNGTVGGLRRVAIVEAGGRVRLGPSQPLDPETGFQIEGISDAGRVLLISEQKETAKLVDGANAAPTVRWPVPKVTSACFSADGRAVLTQAGEPVPGEAAVKVWEVGAAPRLTASFGDDAGGRVQCSRQGGWVLVMGNAKTELWRYGSWTRGPALPVDLQGEDHYARLSPDGATLVIEKDGKGQLIETRTGQPVATLEGTGTPAGICVNEVFSADGARVSLLWQYGSVHVWDLTVLHRELAALGLDWTVGN